MLQLLTRAKKIVREDSQWPNDAVNWMAIVYKLIFLIRVSSKGDGMKAILK